MKYASKKMLAVLTAAMLLCLMLPVTAVVASTDNLVVNGSFENGTDGWACNSGTAEIVADAADGAAALSLTDPGQWGEAAVQTVPVDPNSEYKITWYSKRISGSGAFNLYVMNASGYANLESAGGQNWMNEKSGNWVANEYVVKTANATSMMIKFSSEAVKAGTIYIDDVVVTKVGGGDPIAPTGDNLFINGDFETGDYSGWQVWQSTVITADAAHEGGYGAHLQGNGGWGGMLNQTATVQAGVQYKLSFWLQVNAVGVNVQVKDGSGAGIEGCGGWYDVARAGSGVEVEYVFTATDSAVLLNFCGGGTGSAEDAYADDFKLVAIGGDPDVPGSDVPVEGNLLANAGFESGDLTGWNSYQSTAVSADAAKDGSYGVHLQGTGGWGGMLNQTVTGLEVGKTYRLSLWYKALSGGVNIKLCAGESDAGTAYAYTYGTATSWTSFVTEFEATDTKAFMTFIGSGTGVAESMYVDSLSLTEVVLGGNDEDPNLKLIDTLLPRIRTQGRTAVVGGSLMLDFSISGMEFDLNCEGDVYVTFNARKLPSTSETGGVYFTVYVDGEKLARDYCHINVGGETKIKIASDLPAGTHSFGIYRQSEHQQGEVGVCALSFDGTMLKKPDAKDLYVEFIGDSISCGFGNLGSSAAGDGTALWSDATQAYPFLTAQALDADWSNVSWSGLGCKYGYSSTTMQDVYPAQRYAYDTETAYGFDKEPNIVVLALGTNDNSQAPDNASKREGLIEMLTLVREKNPNAPIVWIYNMMTDGVNTMIEEIVAEFGGAEAGYYACKLTMNTSGGGWHPNLAGQQKFADELVAFIRANGLDVVPQEPADGADLIDGGEIARMEMTEDALGLAFRFTLQAQGVTKDKAYKVDISNATIDALGNGTACKLVAVGAIVTNDMEVGLRKSRMNLDNLSDKTKNVPVVYVSDVTDNEMAFAVRVTNIPTDRSDAILYARAYYVYELDGVQYTVYGEVETANYDDSINTNDGVFDW